MRHRVFTIIMGIMILIGLSGCTQSKANEPADPPVELVEAIEVDFHQMMAMADQGVKYYTRSLDASRIEVVENIERVITPEPYELYYIEVIHQDAQRDMLGDDSQLKLLKVSNDTISYTYSDAYEQVILKKPIKVDQTWETVFFDKDMGFVPVSAKITQISNTEGITVEYKGDDLHQEYVFNLKNGIETERQITPEVTLETHLSKMATSPESDYRSRYVHPSEMIQTLYPSDPLAASVKDTETIMALRAATNDAERLTIYRAYLKSIDKTNISVMQRAKHILSCAMALSESDFDYVKDFVDFYESVYSEMGSEWTNQLGLNDYQVSDALYDYNIDEAYWTLKPSQAITNADYRLMRGVLKAAGAGFESYEGYPYFIVTKDFLESEIVSEDPKVGDYIDYKIAQYSYFPLMVDGYLIRSPETLLKGIYDFEQFSIAYPEDEAFEDAKFYSDYIFEIFAVPSEYEFANNKYINGYIAPDFLEAYQHYASEYEESAYAEYFLEISTLLRVNYGLYTRDLKNYLEDIGYSPYDMNLSSHFVQLEERVSLMQQSKTQLTSVSENRVVVDNVEDFLQAIKPDTLIVLSPGQYTLPYGQRTISDYASLSDGVLTIKGVNHFGITVADNGIADLNTESYLEVIQFIDSYDISLESLRIGHIYEYCVGDVISTDSVSEFQMKGLILYGCGYNGLNLYNSSKILLADSVISDCQASAIVAEDSENILVTNVVMRRNGRQVFQFENTKDIEINQSIIEDNTKDMYMNENGLFKIISSDPVVVKQTRLDNSAVKILVEGDGEVIRLQ